MIYFFCRFFHCGIFVQMGEFVSKSLLITRTNIFLHSFVLVHINMGISIEGESWLLRHRWCSVSGFCTVAWVRQVVEAGPSF